MVKKQRVNFGISQSKPNYGVMAVAEGSRHNFIPRKPFTSGDCSCIVCGARFTGERIHRIFSVIKEPLYDFTVKPKSSFSIALTIKVDATQRYFTFSMFADSAPINSLLLKVTLSNSLEVKCDFLCVTSDLARFEVPFEFAESSEFISILMEGSIGSVSNDSEVRIGFGFLQLEEGLFSTSPIRSGSEGGFRDACQLNVQREQNFFTGQAGTISFFFSPNWTGPQLDPEHSAFFLDCVSDDERNAISIFSDGRDYGKLKATVTNEGVIHSVESEIIPVRGALYAVALRWLFGELELLVNGRSTGLIAATIPKPEQLGSRVFLGSTPRSPYKAAFSSFRDFKAYNGWLSDIQIRSDIYASFPRQFGHFLLDWERQQFPSKPTLFSPGCWAYDVSALLLKLPAIWQESPPIWLQGDAIDEAECRDEVHRTFKLRDWDSVPEFFSYEGRTDLYVKVPDENNRYLRIEFKVWGRHDYKDIPRKPLKYFTDAENKGVVVMINPSLKKNIGMEYRQNVRVSQTGFKDLFEAPFGSDGLPDHFISTHAAPRGNYSEVLHLVVNRHGPFSEKSEN